jgi:hypothetical protein
MIDFFRSKQLFLPVLFVVILFLGCTTARKAIREPLKEQGDAYLMTALKEHELNFNQFSVKFNATYRKGKEETSFSGNLRIEHDKTIWISLTPALGIEAIRFLLTTDSIKYLNRLKENYLCREFKYLNVLLNNTLDFDMAQAFLIGNDFSLYESNKFKASIDNQEYKLSTVNRMKIRRFVRRSEEDISIPIQSIWLNPDNFKITKVLIKEAERESRKFLATYDGFKDVEGQLIPTKIKFAIETDQDKVEIDILLTKIQINQEQTYPFRVPEKYSEIKDIQPAEK